MIAKSRTEKEHIEVLRKLFIRLRKFQLKLNPTKCTFGARSEKLLGFVVSEKGIEINSDKLRAIQELSPLRTQKEVRGEWDEECQKAFDKVKEYLSSPLVLSPPSSDRPLILYLIVFGNSMGCVLRQHDGLRRKEKAIYYLNKKFTEFVKGSAIADFLASRALEDYEPLNFDFPNEEIMYVAVAEEDNAKGHCWKLNFDAASNVVEYEACIMGLRADIKCKIKSLEVYRDSALVIYQLRGEWEIRDAKLINYKRWGDPYKRRKDQVLLRYVDAGESKKILEEVHEVIDYFTNWVKAASYASVTKPTVSKFLKEEIICRYGMPEKIISDNALNLNNSTITENFYWATPFSLAYGMEAVLPIEVEIPSLRAYDKKVRPREFHEGDLVLKKILPIQKDFRGKWIPNWEGPYVVKKAFSGGALILAKMDGRNLPNLVNSDSIKKYYT
ncbi:uncharacterized protein [Gossypium hirsutum]|uniref:Uncharacterized protein n=1 Tax=Gossypium hirsutum TaxID=3635 RepID=A0ABM3BWB2_GOSHI|nr:uncharacterized protein LOC121230517 [Gossypium hirsutum]